MYDFGFVCSGKVRIERSMDIYAMSAEHGTQLVKLLDYDICYVATWNALLYTSIPER